MFVVLTGGDWQLGGGFDSRAEAERWAEQVVGRWLKYEVVAR